MSDFWDVVCTIVSLELLTVLWIVTAYLCTRIGVCMWRVAKVIIVDGNFVRDHATEPAFAFARSILLACIAVLSMKYVVHPLLVE